ncbi:MAG TPA: cytochrome c-type biogenesis protein CcmH [Candidatus Acidoferrales bacterium]|nr:cytochrome c-type biogenesis protein CcmH [Candidatus Acidoferrales bacterium]
MIKPRIETIGLDYSVPAGACVDVPSNARDWRRLFRPANLIRVGCILVVTCSVTLVLAVTFSVRAQDTARAKDLGGKLMCVCGCGQVLISCNHVGCTYSHDMLKELDGYIARNESDDLTLQAFVQEYGPTVLAEPPAKGFDMAAWIVPIIAPLIALYLLWEVVRRWRRRAALEPAHKSRVSPELLARARRETGEDSHE